MRARKTGRENVYTNMNLPQELLGGVEELSQRLNISKAYIYVNALRRFIVRANETRPTYPPWKKAASIRGRRKTTILIPLSDREALDTLCEQLGVSKTWVMEHAIKEYIGVERRRLSRYTEPAPLGVSQT